MDILLLVAGIAILIVGAEIFVNSSVHIAKKLKVPTVIIAMTIIGIGTSAPETVISITASLQGSSDLSMSNIIGSNYFNLLFIIGLCALFRPIKVKLREVGPESWLMVGSTAALFIAMVASRELLDPGDRMSPIVGIVMVVTFIVYLTLLLRHAKEGHRTHHHVTHRKTIEIPEEETQPLWRGILGVAFGLGVILFGGELTVSSAEAIAEQFNVPSRIIGLTIIGAGTSLPELTISLMACIRRESGIALGTIVGTNIYNLLFILGVAGTIDPLLTDSNQMLDLGVLTIGNIMFLIFMLTRKRITRIEGSIMLALYCGYIGYMVAITT